MSALTPSCARPSLGAGASDASVKVDYDMWYPFQWYVRHETEAGILHGSIVFASATSDEDEDDEDAGSEKKDCKCGGRR